MASNQPTVCIHWGTFWVSNWRWLIEAVLAMFWQDILPLFLKRNHSFALSGCASLRQILFQFRSFCWYQLTKACDSVDVKLEPSSVSWGLVEPCVVLRSMWSNCDVMLCEDVCRSFSNFCREGFRFYDGHESNFGWNFLFSSRFCARWTIASCLLGSLQLECTKQFKTVCQCFMGMLIKKKPNRN